MPDRQAVQSGTDLDICPDCYGCGWDNPAEGTIQCRRCGGSGGVSRERGAYEHAMRLFANNPARGGWVPVTPVTLRRWANEMERLRAERDDLRRLLVNLGAGIPAAAILKAEDRTNAE